MVTSHSIIKHSSAGQKSIEPSLPKPIGTEYDLEEVKALFNAKARTWNQKYEAGGSLAFRTVVFDSVIRRQLSPGARVLDLGCGTAAIASALSESGFRVTACDIAAEMIEAGKRIHVASPIEWCLLPGDWKRLPFEPCTFDAIIASSVLEYLPDVSGVLRECQRVLISGGIMIATVPNPHTLIRKLEKLLRPVAVGLEWLPGWSRFGKLRSYTTYLRCSINRMSLGDWVAIGRGANFSEINPIETEVQNTSLIFLVFGKSSD
jgi:ubiquinone/menaquinone biosynthesis C-methylase UbiE